MESVFEDNFIDKIITDPPWGFYQHMDIDINVFYKKMLQEFYRILKPNGILVLLTARKKEFENSLADCQNKYKLVDKYHILVSGKKAAIYKIIKKIK